MGVFEEVLGGGETLFSNAGALDPDFIPKLLPYRENQQRYVALCIKPLFTGQNGRNLIVKGESGIGKTACIKRVLMDLEEETDKIKPVYVNCWNKNTTYKIMTEVAHVLGYKFTHNMSTDELNRKLEALFSKWEGLVFVFDEIDKAEDDDFLYFLLENASKKNIILVTSDMGWSAELDPRVVSRLVPDSVTFEQYSPAEIAGILKERVKYSFYQNVWGDGAFERIVSHAARFKDVRVGLVLLKTAGLEAENDSSRKILLKHAEAAVSRTDAVKVKSSFDLTDEETELLELCKDSSGALFSDLYNIYQLKGGSKSDRTFRRKLKRLAGRGLIDLRPVADMRGQGTQIVYKGMAKTLDDFVPAE